MNDKVYYKSLSEIASALQISYSSLYKHRHRPEFSKTARGYNLNKISDYLNEQERIREEEEKAQSLLGAEDELLEKQLKIETARHKCRLLELQILQKEGNLIDVNQVLETRTKEITRLRRGLTDLVRKLPSELKDLDENSIRNKISDAVNAILSDLSEFIMDDWQSDDEDEQETIEE